MSSLQSPIRQARQSDGESIFEFLRAIPERNAARDFLIDAKSGRNITYQAFHERAIAIASDLRRMGLRRGDHIAMLLQNSVELAEIYFACLYAGFVSVPVNPALSRDEIEHIVQSTGIKIVVASADTLAPLGTERDPLPQVTRLLIGDVKGTSVFGFERWDIGALPTDRNFIPFAGVAPGDAAAIIFTSGTTSRPRGVSHSFANFVGNGRLFVDELGIGADNRFYSTFAMTYMAGYYNLLFVPFIAEASVVITEAFNARSAIRFWDPVIAHKVNTLWLAPTAIAMLVEIDRGSIGREYCRTGMRLVMSATSALPARLRQQFEERYGIPVYESFGLSELLFICTNAPGRPIVEHSVGRSLPSICVTILDEDGNEAAPGIEGEINIASPHQMHGYFEVDKGAVVSAPTPFPTGDVGVLSKDGDLTITGRKKDLIIRGGINISPAGIEEVLYRHPAVLECAVVGVPHRLHGEEPVAAIRTSAEYNFDMVQAELADLCRRHVSAQKRPTHILAVESFPHSVSGKIQKALVQRSMMQRLGISPVSISESAKAPMIPGRVRRTFDRLAPEVIAALAKYPTGIISDCMNRLGMLNSRIHSIAGQRPFCGSALTVEEVEAGNMMSHAALELLLPGDVLIIDAKGTTTRSAFGGLQLMGAQRRGAVAVVVYGTVRDHSDIVKSGLPVYALGTSPGGPMKGWGGNINYPIACAGAVVNPGDVVIGDDDGVVIVPKELAEELPALCEQRLGIEEQWFSRVSQGESTLDVVNLRIQLDRLGIRYD